MKEDVLQLFSSTNNMDKNIKNIMDKIKDLENRSRRNNLRVMGAPENYSVNDLIRLCSVEIPEGDTHPLYS